tara:strand:- start:454 stop:564 length:111 start_codon:yes stop_codon:yes gene_type:complete
MRSCLAAACFWSTAHYFWYDAHVPRLSRKDVHVVVD